MAWERHHAARAGRRDTHDTHDTHGADNTHHHGPPLGRQPPLERPADLAGITLIPTHGRAMRET